VVTPEQAKACAIPAGVGVAPSRWPLSLPTSLEYWASGRQRGFQSKPFAPSSHLFEASRERMEWWRAASCAEDDEIVVVRVGEHVLDACNTSRMPVPWRLKLLELVRMRAPCRARLASEGR
jgi:hypothetical protein